MKISSSVNQLVQEGASSSGNMGPGGAGKGGGMNPGDKGGNPRDMGKNF